MEIRFHRNLVNAVVEILVQVFEHKRYADKTIEYHLKSNPRWGGRDRRFVAETTYDIIRWWRLLAKAAEAEKFTDADFRKVFAAWCVWKNYSLPPFIENINTNKIAERLSKLLQYRTTRESIPDWMDKIATDELGERVWEKEMAALNTSAAVVLRANTIKTSAKQLKVLLRQHGVEASMFQSLNGDDSDALVLAERQNVFRLPEFKQGYFEVQDASSQEVGIFADVKPGMRVIDACAGAGGKTLHLSALMQNKGKIVALDVEQWKLNELKKRAARANAQNIETRILDGAKALKRLENSADRLLLDVPCSGLGVLKRNPDAKWKLSATFIDEVRAKQQQILTDYSTMLKKDGLLIYSTCSILPSENANQVKQFLAAHQQFQFLDERIIMPSQGFDGFYMAKMRKS
jgi:16S rRNA (cytosine967-C5)-methyltransferase